MNDLYIVIPAYNESENIKNVIEDWYPIIEKSSDASKLVIINDGSKDDTLQIAEKIAESKEKMTVITKPNGGHGSTVLYGYRYAIESGADYIFQTDSDGQTNPKEFAQFWELRDTYDAVIGNRVVRGDGKSRKFVENVVCLILKIIFKVNVEDANAPFRLMKADLVAKYIDKLPKDYNLPNIMFTTYFVHNNEKVKFVNISFKPRQGGTNSINIKKIIKIGIKAFSDFMTFRKDMK